MSGDWGLKIAQTGYDVKTCPDNKLVYSSEYPQLKIHSSGSGSHTFTNYEGYITLSTHNLGYRPFFAIWVDKGSGFKLVTFGEQSGDFYMGYLGTAKTDVLQLVSYATYNGGMWGDPTLPPDIEIDYAWIIFYDPIKDE